MMALDMAREVRVALVAAIATFIEGMAKFEKTQYDGDWPEHVFTCNLVEDAVQDYEARGIDPDEVNKLEEAWCDQRPEHPCGMSWWPQDLAGHDQRVQAVDRMIVALGGTL